MCIVVLQMRCLGPRLFVYQSFNINFNVGSGKSKTRIQCFISHLICFDFICFIVENVHSHIYSTYYRTLSAKSLSLGNLSLQTNFQKLSWFSSHSLSRNSGMCVSTLISIEFLRKRRLGFSYSKSLNLFSNSIDKFYFFLTKHENSD